jgi:Uma2 family endonuclease
LAPDLVVEVLIASNTKGEMNRKLREYFEAGVRLVWLVDHRKRVVRVHIAVDQPILYSEDQSLDGGAVLPGFTLALERIVRPGRAVRTGGRVDSGCRNRRPSSTQQFVL